MTVTTLPTPQDPYEQAVAAGHPSVAGRPRGQEVTVYLDDEAVDILMRTAGIARGIRTWEVDEDVLGSLVHTAIRLGVKELDTAARSQITTVIDRSYRRPIRSGHVDDVDWSPQGDEPF